MTQITPSFSLSEAFVVKTTENGDIAFNTSGNHYADLIFLSEYYTKHPEEAVIGNSDFDKIFAMMVRDPRFGLGMRTYGRKLMSMAEVSAEDTVLAGRFDDLLFPMRGLDFIKSEIEKGNELAKKWMPRFSSSKEKKQLAHDLAKTWGMNKQTYNKFVKVATTESRLTEKDTDSIKFEQVPSNASVKYAHRFATGEDTKERYAAFLASVKKGEAKLHTATTSVYDIYKNMNKEGFDPDLFFNNIPKTSLDAIAIVDTSASMLSNDAMGKALAIGHYIGKNSTYMPNHAITFSSKPCLIEMGVGIKAVGEPSAENRMARHARTELTKFDPNEPSQYKKEINSLHTGDCSNTDFAAVLNLLKYVGKEHMPKYLVVLSDQEFDQGSYTSKNDLQRIWAENGITTKIVWWNFNGRNRTFPEMDTNGNFYLSGYNPTLLQYLESDFDSAKLINKLVSEYAKKVGK